MTDRARELVERLLGMHERLLAAKKKQRPYRPILTMGQSDADTVMGAAIFIEQSLTPPEGDTVSLLRRVTDVAENLAGELDDPGTEALAAIYCARAALQSRPTVSEGEHPLAKMTRLADELGLFDDGERVPLSPNAQRLLVVAPCLDVNGNVRCYDLGPPTEPDATHGVVVASVYSGEEVANKIARLWNDAALQSRVSPQAEMREALEGARKFVEDSFCDGMSSVDRVCAQELAAKIDAALSTASIPMSEDAARLGEFLHKPFDGGSDNHGS